MHEYLVKEQQLYLIIYPKFYFFLMFCQILLAKNLTFMNRDWSKFKQENFIFAYFEKDWPELMQIDWRNVSFSLESSLSNLNSILDAHAPLKSQYKQLKFKTKQWITHALQNIFLLKINLLMVPLHLIQWQLQIFLTNISLQLPIKLNWILPFLINISLIFLKIDLISPFLSQNDKTETDNIISLADSNKSVRPLQYSY